MWLLIAFVVTVTSVVANDNLRVAYQWKQIDFEYPSIDERQAAILNETFIQENVIPVGLEVYKNRLFITLPRWKKGVPASLAYIDLNGKNLRLFHGCLQVNKRLLQHHHDHNDSIGFQLSLSFVTREIFFIQSFFFILLQLNWFTVGIIKCDIMRRKNLLIFKSVIKVVVKIFETRRVRIIMTRSEFHDFMIHGMLCGLCEMMDHVKLHNWTCTSLSRTLFSNSNIEKPARKGLS